VFQESCVLFKILSIQTLVLTSRPALVFAELSKYFILDKSFVPYVLACS